ncbi:MAG: hypothetical protein ACR2QG_02735 [Gammaproteobacteria bacterium]
MAGSQGSSGSSGSSGSMGSGGMSGSAGSASGSMGSSGGMAGSAGGAAGGMPDIPSGTGTGTGDLDEIFNGSLGDFDGGIAGEREVIAQSGGGSAKAAGQREQTDADSVDDGWGGGVDGSMADTDMGAGGMPGNQTSGAAGQAGEGVYSPDGQREGGDFEESEDQKVVELPDDIPVDGSGDDVVGRQIREAAIAMQDVDPKAAEALWDEYRKHTGIK